jgi:hypothetical protein
VSPLPVSPLPVSPLPVSPLPVSPLPLSPLPVSPPPLPPLPLPVVVVGVVGVVGVVVVAEVVVVVVVVVDVDVGGVVDVVVGGVVVVVVGGVVVVVLGGVVGVTVAHLALEMSFVSSVTAPLRASNRPSTSAPVFAVIDVRAMMLPWKSVVVPSVAELPTCQNTLHARAPLIRLTPLFDAVVRVDPIWKMKRAFGFPAASRVRSPVSWADDEKQ